MLRNAMGGWGEISRTNCYKGVRYNVISVTRERVGVKFPGKMCYEGVRFNIISIMGEGGEWCVKFPEKKRYKRVRFNVISITRGWHGCQMSRKKCYKRVQYNVLALRADG